MKNKISKKVNPLDKQTVTKLDCVHDWKIISFYSPSCSQTCKKCGKTVL